MRGTMITAGALLVVTGCQNPATPSPGHSDDVISRAAATDRYVNHRYSRPTPVPDADPAGAMIGPLPIPDDGAPIHDVVLEIDVLHPYAGDLTGWLYYDEDRDGVSDAATPIELYLARPGERDAPPLWGHPVALGGRYFFGHEAEVPTMGGWDGDEFATFRGLRRGGEFLLRIADQGVGDTGVVVSWAVHMR